MSGVLACVDRARVLLLKLGLNRHRATFIERGSCLVDVARVYRGALFVRHVWVMVGRQSRASHVFYLTRLRRGSDRHNIPSSPREHWIWMDLGRPNFNMIQLTPVSSLCHWTDPSATSGNNMFLTKTMELQNCPSCSTVWGVLSS